MSIPTMDSAGQRSATRTGFGFISALYLVFGLSSHLAAADLETLRIAEGIGLVDQYGDVVTIGMTRSEVLRDAINVNCASAYECIFTVSRDTGTIIVQFDTSGLANHISVLQSGVPNDQKWPNEIAGQVLDGMTVGEVATLYSDLGYEAEIIDKTITDRAIITDLNYTYERQEHCYNTCSVVYTAHRLAGADVPPGDGEPPMADKYFEGEILLTNPRPKDEKYSVSLEILGPEGFSRQASFTVRIPKRGSVSYEPGSFVSLDSAAGVYEYIAILSNNKGRTVGTSTGAFTLVDPNTSDSGF